jgi:hypothetical protein
MQVLDQKSKVYSWGGFFSRMKRTWRILSFFSWLGCKNFRFAMQFFPTQRQACQTPLGGSASFSD